jgi:hypothetical protein
MHAFPALIGRCGTRRDRSGRPLACATSPPGSSTLEPEALHGPMGIGLQVGELSPCHAGLAEPRCQRLLPFSAFSACSCSLALSGPGEPLTLGCPLHPTHLRWGCCMHYCGAPDAGGSRLQALVRPAWDAVLSLALPAPQVVGRRVFMSTDAVGHNRQTLDRGSESGCPRLVLRQ